MDSAAVSTPSNLPDSSIICSGNYSCKKYAVIVHTFLLPSAAVISYLLGLLQSPGLPSTAAPSMGCESWLL